MKKIILFFLAAALQLNAQQLQEHFKGEALSAKMGILSRLQQLPKNGNGTLQKAPLSFAPKYGSNNGQKKTAVTSEADYGFNSNVYQGANVPMQSIADGFGNIYTTGVSADAVTPRGSFVTIKTDASGNIVWAVKKPVTDFAVEYGMAIALDPAGNPIATGMHWNGTDMDVHTVKMDATSGTVIWQTNFSGAAGGLDIPSAIVTDNLGNTVVAGITYSGTSIRYLILKYNAAGLLQWSYTDDNAVEDVWNEATAVAVDALGRIAVTGYGSNANYYQTYYTVALSASGDKLWNKNYTFQVPSDPEDPGSALADTNSVANDVAFDASGNCYVTGIFNTSWGKMGTIKYDSNGTQQWIMAHESGTDNTTAHEIAVSGSTIYVSGRHMGDWFEDGLTLISYDADGIENWVTETLNLADAKVPKLILDANGLPVQSGYGYDENSNTVFKTQRYTSNGISETETTYTLPAVPTESLGGLKAISLDNAGNLYLSLAYTYTEAGQVFKVVKMPFANGSPETAWNTNYSGSALSNKIVLAAVTGTAGNVYTVGSFGQIDGENYIINYYLEKYGPTGNVEWQKVYNPANGNDSNGIQVQVTPGGEAIVHLIPFGFGDPLKLIKYDLAGNVAWAFEKTVHQPSFGAFFTDSNGNAYLSGSSKQNEDDENPVFTTIKVSAAGQEQWTVYTPSVNAADNVYTINAGTADSNGNLIIAGNVGTGSFFSEDVSAALIKYDSTGTIQWFTATPTEGFNSAATDLLIQSDGSIVINGAISSQDTGQEKMLLRKFNAAGQQQWESIVGEEGRNVRSYKTLLLSNGDLAVAAFSVIYGVTNKVIVVRFDAQGNQTGLSETGEAHFYRDAYVDGSDTVYLLTQYYGTTLPYRIFYSSGSFYAGKVIKIATDNTLTEEELIGPALSPYNPANFAVNGNTLLIPGTLESDAFAFQGVYFFESEFELLGIDEHHNPVTKQNWLGQNYPNPAGSTTAIPVTLEQAGNVDIALYDIAGRFIRQLYKDFCPAGTSALKISLAGLGKGIYLYKAIAENGSVATRKLIIK